MSKLTKEQQVLRLARNLEHSSNIVGLKVINNEHPKCAPGITPNRPFDYQTVFFGATREYGPDEGWQPVINGRRKKRVGWKGERTQVEQPKQKKNAFGDLDD
jgi:hypothetical protein